MCVPRNNSFYYRQVTQVYRARDRAAKLNGAEVRLREALDQFYGNVTLSELAEDDNGSNGSHGSNSGNGFNGGNGSNGGGRGEKVVERRVHRSLVEVRISKPNQLRQALLYAQRVVSGLGLVKR